MTQKKTRQATTRTAKKLMLITLFMFAFGFALVPIYNVMCKQLGINGKVSNEAKALSNGIDTSRSIQVLFLATNNANLPWNFKPNISSIRIHPGENTRISYFAKNNTDHAMTSQAIPSIAPGLAAQYLKKTECFCFTQQTLGPHQSMDMPILFHIDTDIPKDIDSLSLSYTLFHVKDLGNAKKGFNGKLHNTERTS